MVTMNNQRLESAENGIAELREQMSSLHMSIAEQVTNAVQIAITALQQSLAAQISENMESATKKSTDEIAAATQRLEGRIERARENQEMAMALLKQDHEKLQLEVHASLTERRGTQNGSPVPLESNGNSMGNFSFGRVGFNVPNETFVHRSMGSVGAPLTSNDGNGGLNEGQPLGDPGGAYGGNPQFWRNKKLDLATFDGNNPDGWILRAQRYFRFYRLSEEDKVEAAVVSLEGDALLWFQWEHGRRPINT